MPTSYDSETLHRLQQVELQILKDFSAVCKKHGLTYFAIYGTAIGTVRHHGFIPWDDDIDVCMLRQDYDRFVEIAQSELGDRYDLLTIENTDGYVMTLAKLSRKNTVFVEATDQNRTYDSGIFMDIFPYDVISADPKKRAKQIKKAWFWGRMCVMREYKDVKLPEGMSGAKRKLAAGAAGFVHGLLKLFHISKLSLYRRFLKAARGCENSEDEYYADFSGVAPDKTILAKKDLFPVTELDFEDTRISIMHNYDNYLTLQYGDYMTMPPEEERTNHYPAALKFEDETP